MAKHVFGNEAFVWIELQNMHVPCHAFNIIMITKSYFSYNISLKLIIRNENFVK